MSERLDGIGLVFDMDGVLVDSYHAHMRSWQLLGQELGQPVSEPDFARTFGQTSRDIIRHLFGSHRAKEDIQRLDDRKEALYRGLIRGRVPLMPGASDALHRMRAAGARLAVGSSGPPENVELVVEAFAPLRFDGIVTGADVQHGKPDPQVFLLAAERLGLPAAACIVVEDAAVGIEAAHRAGMRTIGFVGLHGSDTPPGCDASVRQFSELTVSAIHYLARHVG